MFLRASRWQVGACAFHIQPAKQSLRMSTKLAVLPTFVSPVAEIVPPPIRDRMLWLALFTEQRLDQPIIPYRGAISDATYNLACLYSLRAAMAAPFYWPYMCIALNRCASGVILPLFTMYSCSGTLNKAEL